MKKNIAMVLAGGIGSRFGGDKPKQYYLINGKEMIFYSLDAFKAAETIDDIVLVLNEDEYMLDREIGKYKVHTILGGQTRNHSFANALKYIAETFPDCEKIIENNAACPMITPNIIDDYIRLLDDYDYVHTTFKITDALGSFKYKEVNREDFYLIQSPDAYRFKEIYNHFNPDSVITHPAQHLPETAKGFNYFDFGPNFKVTYPEDIEMVELLLKRRMNSL